VPGAPAALLSLALVGHEPDLGDLAASLLGARPGSLPLRKAGLAVLQWRASGSAAENGTAAHQQGSWQLQLLLAPRILLG
jgi:phosphohistidine phosphatase